MNKEIVTKLLQEKLAAKLAQKKEEVAKKVLKEATEGYAIRLKNGKLAKTSGGHHFWHTSEEGAHKVNKASHGGEGSVVKVGLKRTGYGHNGHEIHESAELQEDHFSDSELENLLDKFEKEMNSDGAKAVEEYMSAEADGNKAGV